MDAVSARGRSADEVGEVGESLVGAFRAADQFAVEVWQAVRGLPRTDEGERLARELRRTAAMAAGALVGASAVTAGDPRGRAGLDGAKAALLESRYYLYLAKRLGLLDLRRYRQLATRQDAALRGLEAILGASGPWGRGSVKAG